jgi:hypothetical protein
MSNDDCDWQKQHTERQERTRTQLFDALATAGIAKVAVVFDGESDNGQIDEVFAMTADKKGIDLPAVSLTVQSAAHDGTAAEQASRSIREVIEGLCYHLLEDHYAGWEINGGAFGEFQFNVADRTIALTFNERLVEINTSTQTL